jgi:signal transduction histidine kinase
MATSFFALLLVGISFSVWSNFTAKRNLTRSLYTQAEMVAQNCQAALAFEDADGAKDTLQSLSVIPSIVYGVIYTAQGEGFASYRSNSEVDMPSSLKHYAENYSSNKDVLTAIKNIKLDSEVIGTVVLCSDLGPVKKMLAQNIRIIMSFLVIVSLLTYLVSSKLQRIVSRPILDLAQVASVVSTHNDYSVRAEKNSNDEIGFLIDSFNYMLDHIQAEVTDRKRAEEDVIKLNETLEQRVILRTAELEKTHKQLMKASHHAGMAEVATDVLHNVGNVLNSVNVQTTLIEKKVMESKAGKICEIAEMINSNLDNIDSFLKQDEKGKHIPGYLCSVSSYMVEEQTVILEKLASLTKNVDHIKEVITMQQSYAKSAGVSTITTISEIVDDAIQINLAGLMRHGVELKREHQDMGEIALDRQRVVQILVNLIGNAKYAVTKNNCEKKKIIIKSYKQDDECVIEVIDNGIGISAESLTKIFGHGFTTKSDGHGFGLHSGALAAKEMKGSLSVHSDGLGQGAMFRLVIPLKLAEVHNG